MCKLLPLLTLQQYSPGVKKNLAGSFATRFNPKNCTVRSSKDYWSHKRKPQFPTTSSSKIKEKHQPLTSIIINSSTPLILPRQKELPLGLSCSIMFHHDFSCVFFGEVRFLESHVSWVLCSCTCTIVCSATHGTST